MNIIHDEIMTILLRDLRWNLRRDIGYHLKQEIDHDQHN